MALVIADERDTADDLLLSAARFKQVVNLWQLSEARPESSLAKYLSEGQRTLLVPLSRLLYGPSIRWEKSPRGLRGHPIDMGEEGKIGFLLEMAERRRSEEFLALVKQSADRLIAHWNGHVPDFSAVRRLLQKIAAQNWLLERGGRTFYRKVLDGMLEHLRFASAADWLELLTLPDEALDWTATDQSNLNSEFESYRDNGVSDDRHNCSTVDEMDSLIGSLSELGQKAGTDFSYDIGRLSEQIAEREEERTALEEGNDTPSGTLLSATAPVVSVDDVRQMFWTLKNE